MQQQLQKKTSSEKVGLTLSLRVGRQDKMLYAFQPHSFFLSDVDKSIHQLQAPDA